MNPDHYRSGFFTLLIKHKYSRSILIRAFGMGMRLRSIVSYFVALNHGKICSLFGVFGKPGNEIIIVSSGYATAGVDDRCQRAGIIVEVGNGFCQKKKGTALPSPVRVMLFYGSLDGAFVRG